MENDVKIRCEELGMIATSVENLFIETQGVNRKRKTIIGYCKNCKNNLILRFDNLYRITVNKVYCETCVINNYINILKARGCQFIRKYKNKNKVSMIDYVGVDNYIFSVRVTNIISNEFKVSQKIRQNKYYLYRFAFALNGNMYFKIGYSFDPCKRLRSLKLHNDCSISILRIFNNEAEARDFERKVHKGFKDCKIDKTEADTFTEGLRRSRTKDGIKYTKDGITEWFKIPLEFYCRIGDPVSHYLFEKGIK